MDLSKTLNEALLGFLLPEIRQVMTNDYGTVVINTSSWNIRANKGLFDKLFAAM